MEKLILWMNKKYKYKNWWKGNNKEKDGNNISVKWKGWIPWIK